MISRNEDAMLIVYDDGHVDTYDNEGGYWTNDVYYHKFYGGNTPTWWYIEFISRIVKR